MSVSGPAYLIRLFAHVMQERNDMDQKKRQQIEKNLEIIAKKEGISAEEVKTEIGRAISYALKNNDPEIQKFWKNIPCEGESPTVEEIIAYLAEQLSNPNA